MNGDCWLGSERAWWRTEIVICFTLQRLSGHGRTLMWPQTAKGFQDEQQEDRICLEPRAAMEVFGHSVHYRS
jgi:hypothetical protein